MSETGIVNNDGPSWGERIRTSDWLIQNQRSQIQAEDSESGANSESADGGQAPRPANQAARGRPRLPANALADGTVLPIESGDARALARYRARGAVQRAVKRGQIRKPSRCQSCREQRALEAHHHLGYAQQHWLTVRWFCRTCHTAIHHPSPTAFTERYGLVLGEKTPDELFTQLAAIGHRPTAKSRRILRAAYLERVQV